MAGTAIQMFNGQQIAVKLAGRLAQIATRCPVHEILVKGIVFTDNASFV